jgi:hypothetical protein
MSSSIPTILQHVSHIAARVQAIAHRLDAVSEDLADLRQSMGGGDAIVKPDDLVSLREDIKRDVIRERAMMEASLEHRIDQQITRHMPDASAGLARVEGRLDALENRVSGLGSGRPTTASRQKAAAAAE